MKKPGKDVTLVSYNKMVKVALAASEQLASEGIDAEVIDLRTIRPMDYDCLIESLKKTNRMVIVEESWPFGSVSTEITYVMQNRAFDHLDAPIRRVCTADASMHYAPTLVDAFLPNPIQVTQVVKEVMYMQ